MKLFAFLKVFALKIFCICCDGGVYKIFKYTLDLIMFGKNLMICVDISNYGGGDGVS